MRIKISKLIVVFIICLNVLASYFTWRLFSYIGFGTKGVLFQTGASQHVISPVKTNNNKHLSKLVTVVIRQFELYENDVSATVESILTFFPNIQVYIVCDDLPYPPLDILFSNSTAKNVRLFNLAVNLNTPLKDRLPLLSINTKYVLFIPDSSRLPSRHVVQTLVNEISKYPNDMCVAFYANDKNQACLKIELNVLEWTIKYTKVIGEYKSVVCDAIVGKHALLVETEVLKRVTEPFMLPFPEALYLQTAALNSKIHVVNSQLWEGRPVLHSHHAQLRREQLEFARRKQAYSQLSLKKIVRETGVIDWFGCTRDTSRCFGTVFDSVPSYLYKKLWTPPCCLAHLRRTARHVFSCLVEAGVRHWLEAGSLLGAMRNGDILPWDYDVDVGINRDDLHKVVWLTRALDKATTDEQGFVWEKATEGQFFRVHYSKKNRIYVNIFPFYLKNGTMMRDGWFTSHKNMEFPDYFLHPISSIEFLGKTVPCPNNIRDFLELKFGKGSIENPRYPDPVRLKFPKKLYKNSFAINAD